MEVGGSDRVWTLEEIAVEMPDRRLDLLLRLLHQNDGKLSKTKRAQFDELTDAELVGIQDAYAEAFATPSRE
jgi:hypothetical protein